MTYSFQLNPFLKTSGQLSYKTIWVTIQNIARDAGIKKRVNPHSFRHKVITSWILDGLYEQEVKHQAGWSRSSMQMLRIYANFTDEEINIKIFEQ
jgi:integrase/recombinase XerD